MSHAPSARNPPKLRGVAAALPRDAAQLPPKQPPTSTNRSRAEARELGIVAERAAREHLIANGFEIVATNVRSGRYEIDLLARERSVLVVVEVRARGPGSLVRPLDTIDAKKRARIRAAARQLWRARYSRDQRFERVRFDCIAVTVDASGTAQLEHVRAAF